MTAAIALMYALSDNRTVYDRHGDPHWVEWVKGQLVLCSESCFGAFHLDSGPYSTRQT
jgi:hypothetical protein